MKRIYLDFDGVVNAFSNKPPRSNTGWLGSWGEERIDGMRVFWSADLVDELNRLARRPDLEIVWATDWRSKAVELVAPVIGLEDPCWAFLDASEARIEVREPWWKLEAIAEDLNQAKPERAVFIDDNVRYARGITDWHRSLGMNFWTLNTNTHHGISRKQLKMVEEFLG